jgi:hypothetical protein
MVSGTGGRFHIFSDHHIRDQRDDQPVVLPGTLVARIGHQCSTHEHPCVDHGSTLQSACLAMRFVAKTG